MNEWVFPGDVVAVASQIGSRLEPDNQQWTNRFIIGSQTSDRTYVVAQRRTSGEWGCACPGWRHHRHCKHVDDLMGRLRRLGYYQQTSGHMAAAEEGRTSCG